MLLLRSRPTLLLSVAFYSPAVRQALDGVGMKYGMFLKTMHSRAPDTLLALDAMGVLYASGDDVAELLIPFIQSKGSHIHPDEIKREYVAASLGQIDATSFWHRVGLEPAVEDEYLRRHQLAPGVRDRLESAKAVFAGVACISNDVSRWSEKLRRAFLLDQTIDPWVISADVGVRKPSREIYDCLMKKVKVGPRDILLVDDRPGNLDAARALGMRTVLFDPGGTVCQGNHRRIRRLSELLHLPPEEA